MVVRALALYLICSIAIGCAPRKTLPSTMPPQQISYFNHTVTTQGETLGHIAEWYSGDWKNWELIASHNPGLNPSRIKVGDGVKIPESILVKRAPLPKEQVVASQMRRVVGKMNVSGEKLKSFVSGMMSQFRSTK